MQAQSIPQMFFERAASRGHTPAQLSKSHTAWAACSWQAMSDRVRHIAFGLLTLDVQLGDRIAILSDSRPEWVQCDLSILATGAITVPIYPSSTDEQIAYLLNDSEACLVFVDTAAQYEKLMRIRADIPTLRDVIMMGHLEANTHAGVLSLDQLIERGAAANDQTAVLQDRLQHLSPEHDATYVYTSGTTGPPKGVVQSHGNHLFMVQSCAEMADISAGDIDLLFLPLAHSFARLEAFLGIYIGTTTAFAENIDALAQNMREVRPMVMFSVPRVYEKIYARVMANGTSGPPIKQAIFRWAVGVGRQVSTLQQQQQPIPALLQFKYNLAHKLVFHKLHQAVGGRLRYFISGGAPLAQEVAEFFHAAGMLILEGYGLTETCPALTGNRHDQYKFGTVGKALPGVEIKLAADGEILARGPNIAKGYYKRPQETAEVFLADGWFATGDIGELDDDGFLRITDRKKDLIVTAGGKNIAPQNIENLFKTDRYISQAMVYGDRKKYLAAVLTLDAAETTQYAQAQGIAFERPEELATHPQIHALIEDRVTQLNQRLASYETIKKFIIAPSDFTPENGELTPTLKIKRKAVTQKYQTQLEQLYEEA